MKLITKSMVALLATTALAQAGGVERSAQSVGILFEEGTYAELSFSSVSPDVSGVALAGPVATGDIATDYLNVAFRYRQDITDELSFALIGENHIGADVNYASGTGYPIAPSVAELPAFSLTALLRYEMPSSVSVYGGVRVAQASGDVSLFLPTVPTTYTLETDTSTAVGYVLGVAYEIPEIALRVALTYNSAYTHEFQGSETGLAAPSTLPFETEIPQSVMLEAQSGIAEDTLLFGSIRWVDWTEFDITPQIYGGAVGSLVSYDNDSVTYTLGVGRRFTDTFSGAVSVVFEPENNTQGSNLGPTDGRIALGLGGTYTMPNGVEVSGGVQYSWLGDTVTSVGTFEDNTTIAAGLTIGMSF